MKAVGYLRSLAIDDPDSLQDIELPVPRLELPHDLLISVSAVSVNPVDTKVRRNRQPEPGQPVVLGWDAVGTVLEAGPRASGFKPGERVFYAGDRNRSGSNSEFQLVDSRLVAHAPASLGDAQAAALPLTSITAWELLFERLGVSIGSGEGESLLIVGAAGGVGSMLAQLARQLTRLRVIATASRPESVEWIRSLGAEAVIDHHQSFLPQLQALGQESVTMVASLTHTAEHLDDIVAVLAPRGKLALIDDFPTLDVMKLKVKSLSLHWESMFTRSHFQTADMEQQGRILGEIARLAENGRLRTTLTRSLGRITAANIRLAHQRIESGHAIGKLVLEGFQARGHEISVKPIAVVVPEEKFRDEELFTPLEIWSAAGIPTAITSTRKGEITGDLGGKTYASALIDELNPDGYSAIAVIGGTGTISQLWDEGGLQEKLREFARAGKLTSAICAGSVTLAQAGLLEGRTATTYPLELMSSALEKAGALYREEAVIDHGDVITASGPAEAADFANAVATALNKRRTPQGAPVAV